MADGGATRPPSTSSGSGISMDQYYKSAVDTERASKVPEVTLGFWIIKDTRDDARRDRRRRRDDVDESRLFGWNGDLCGDLRRRCVTAQMSAKRFHPLLYWTVIVATTTVGTTLADFVDRSLGIGYLGGSSLLAALLVVSLALWHRTMGTVSIGSINSKSAETYYWVTILFSQTLGTALGDWMADSTGLGYAGGALLFAAGLAVVVGTYFWTKISRTVLFWVAFVLTRPLGATVGDFLDKPLDHGGLALSRYTASASLAAIMVLLIVLVPQRSGKHPA